jgi:hypothetical protein
MNPGNISKFLAVTRQLTAMSLIAIAIASCSGGKMEPTASTTTLPSIKNVPAETWQKLSQKKIYFGHRSVGMGIVDGVADLVKENQDIKINILETKDPAVLTKPVFAHSGIGHNSNPRSKMDEFIDLMNSGMGNSADFAIIKFCWIDFPPGADVDKIFTMYINSISDLKQKFPGTVFIHMTVPLTSEGSGVKFLIKKAKDFIKKVVGKTNVYDNTKRNVFNAMLLKEYNGKEPVFNLAEIEATRPDGKKIFFVNKGKENYSLLPEYTNDGGHLNEKGRKLVAAQLLIFLANLTQK